MTTAPILPAADITAVILAGGRARRMGGEDKGLISFRGRPMIKHVIAALEPQVGGLIISANRNLERYRAYGYPVVTDIVADYAGPLAGIASGMQAAASPCILCVPCDAPFVPGMLAGVLSRTLADHQADICAAHDGIRIQQLFALSRRDLLPALLAYLEAGGRRVESWYRQQRLALADFSGCPDAFANINTADDKCRVAPAAASQPGIEP
jgi:molybdopterin-guanine dinucleotide biosynthesis protein A